VPDGFDAEELTEDGFEGVRVSTGFDSIDELNSLLSSAGASAVDHVDVGALDSLELTHDGDEFVFRADVGEVSDTFAQELGDDETMSEIGTEMLADLFDFRFRLTLPGDVTDHNADQATGGELVWLLDLSDSTRTELYAMSTVSHAWKLLRTIRSVDVIATIEGDQSGSFTVTLAPKSGVEPFDLVADLGDASGWEIADPELSGAVEIRTTFASASELEQQLRSLAPYAIGPIAGAFDQVDIAVADGQMHVGLGAGDIDPLLAGALGGEAGTTMTVLVSVPGEIISANGRVADDGTVSWNLGPDDSAATYAVISDISSSLFPWLLIGAVVVAVAGIIVLSLWYRRRERPRGTDDDPPAGVPDDVAKMLQ